MSILLGRFIKVCSLAFLMAMTSFVACSSSSDSAWDAPRCDGQSSTADRFTADCTHYAIKDPDTGNETGGDKFDFTHSGDFTAPTLGRDGETGATSTQFVGNIAYTAYNTKGELARGAFDIRDLGNPAAILQSYVISDTDINNFVISNNKVYWVGANGNGAALGRFGLTPAGLFGSGGTTGTTTTASTAKVLKSYAGTGVAVNSSYVYTTSGDGSGQVNGSYVGGFGMFNLSDFSLVKEVYNYDARDVSLSMDGSMVSVVSGEQKAPFATATGKAKITQFSAVTGLPMSPSFDVRGGTITQSKSTILMGRTLTLVATGPGGYRAICTATGYEVASVAQLNTLAWSGLATTLTVANSAMAWGPGFIIGTSGEGGLDLIMWQNTGGYAPNSTCPLGTMTRLGSVALPGTHAPHISANDVSFKAVRWDPDTGRGFGYLIVGAGVEGSQLWWVQSNIPNANVDSPNI